MRTVFALKASRARVSCSYEPHERRRALLIVRLEKRLLPRRKNVGAAWQSVLVIRWYVRILGMRRVSKTVKTSFPPVRLVIARRKRRASVAQPNGDRVGGGGGLMRLSPPPRCSNFYVQNVVKESTISRFIGKKDNRPFSFLS